MAVPDIYATAKTNLRDNVKTIITVFGGVAGVLLAGTPFSGFGALDVFTGRWYVASLTLIAALVLVGWSLRILLKVLEPDLAYTSALRDDFNVAAAPSSIQPELAALKKEFAARKAELLPDASVTKLQENADKAWDEFLVASEPDEQRSLDVASAGSNAVALPDPNTSSATVAREKFDELKDTLTKINHWSAYTRLHFRVRRGIDKVLWLGLCALLCIGAFSWSVSKKDEKSGGPNVVVVGVLKSTPLERAELPPIKPIEFDTNKWNLSKEALDAVGTARDYVRSHPKIGVLVFAYTDTEGTAKINRNLAAKRAEAVASALIREGGVSASRVFVTQLPETDLPQLTGQEENAQSNRIVQLVLFPMSDRK